MAAKPREVARRITSVRPGNLKTRLKRAAVLGAAALSLAGKPARAQEQTEPSRHEQDMHPELQPGNDARQHYQLYDLHGNPYQSSSSGTYRSSGSAPSGQRRRAPSGSGGDCGTGAATTGLALSGYALWKMRQRKNNKNIEK